MNEAVFGYFFSIGSGLALAFALVFLCSYGAFRFVKYKLDGRW